MNDLNVKINVLNIRALIDPHIRAEECDNKKKWVIRRIISEINLTFN